MTVCKKYPILLITARIGSRRLPGKVLKKIWRNRSILEFIIRRFQSVPEMSRLCLATVDTPENDDVAAIGAKCKIRVVRGPENDVVGRMALCLENEEFEYVGRITADNPLTDPYLLRAQWREMIRQNADYSYCKTVPVGMAADLWSKECFESTIKRSKGSYEREHANAHVWNNDTIYRILWFKSHNNAFKFNNSSVTVDTKKDYLRIKKIIGITVTS